MREQRKSARQKTLYGARISVDAFAGWAVDCTVRNLGEGGARIALPSRATIPDTFKLFIPSRTTEAARLVWHRNGVVGVTFAAEDMHIVESSVIGTRLERRIAAIVNRELVTGFPFERRARMAPSLKE